MSELEQLRDWLRKEAVTHVVMESTGSYWKPVFNVMEETVKVYLANAQEVKARKGHKKDDKDGWWLAHLLRHAMIHPSFIPPRSVRELRDLTRRRERLNGAGRSEKNRVQKILEDANVKLGNVLSDVFGVSGQLMLVDFDLRGSAQRRALPGAATGASPGHPDRASGPAPRSKVGQTRHSKLLRPAGTGKALLSGPRITFPYQTNPANY